MAIKALIGRGGLSLLILAPWIAAIVVCGALAQYSAVAALQRGGAIETIGLMGLVASAAQILSGVVVFGDPLATGPVGIGLQATAFGLVCVSALLLPPSRAGSGSPGSAAHRPARLATSDRPQAVAAASPRSGGCCCRTGRGSRSRCRRGALPASR